MGIVVSLLLVGVGAILIWGVTGEAQGVDVDAIGVILIAVGLLSFLLTIIFWSSWWGRGTWRRSTYAAGEPVARREAHVEDARVARPPVERRTVVEEEDVPPVGPPPPP